MIPLFYYPTGAVCIDDDVEFLQVLKKGVANSKHYQFFTNPKEAVKVLKHQQANDVLLRCMKDLGDDISPEHIAVNLDISSISEYVYNDERFSELSTVVIDYSMPQLDGEKFCQQLMDLPYKKIMLTGEADIETAVRLFNQQLIDKFIQKSGNLRQNINDGIAEMNQLYFEEISRHFLEKLGYVSLIKRLSNASFINYFNDLIKQNQFVEYYLLDTQGSYLLLDKEGNTSWFIVCDAEKLDDYYDFALQTGEANEALLTALKQQKQIPFFLTSDDKRASPADWQPYMHKVDKLKLENSGHLFVAFVKDNSLSLNASQIKSFSDSI